MQFYTQQLDYTIESVEDRMSLVKGLLEDSADLASFAAQGNKRAQNVVERMANYVLFAYKGDKKVSKEFKIETKHSSYSRRKDESLDQLLDSPTFDENRVKPLARNIYTKPKESISEEDLYDVPGLLEMRTEIELFELILEVNKEKAEYGLPANVPELSEYQMYKWKHMCIDMRRSQYLLKDSAKPKTNSKAHLTPHFFGGDKYDTIATDKVIDQINGIPVINFGDKRHVYALLCNYVRIVENSFDNLNGDIKYVVWELEDYIERTPLTQPRKDILTMKIDAIDNERIAEHLHETYGLDYNPNYISTIWKHEICADIAETAILANKEWEARNTNSMWKTCSCCGGRKLKDHANFGKKSSSVDGYNAVCKQCLKEKRDAGKKYA